MTKINTRLWPQPFTAGKWYEIGGNETLVETATSATLDVRPGDGVACFMLHLENILALGELLFKGMRPPREYHVSFDYVLSC